MPPKLSRTYNETYRADESLLFYIFMGFKRKRVVVGADGGLLYYIFKRYERKRFVVGTDDNFTFEIMESKKGCLVEMTKV